MKDDANFLEKFYIYIAAREYVIDVLSVAIKLPSKPRNAALLLP